MSTPYYAAILKFDSGRRQADPITKRHDLMADAAHAAYEYIGAKLAKSGGKANTRRVWGQFVAPEYMFANPVAHGMHQQGDVRHLSEGTKVSVEKRIRDLSAKHPRLLFFPGTVAWKKPVQRTLGTYLQHKTAVDPSLKTSALSARFGSKPSARIDKAAGAVHGMVADFSTFFSMARPVSNPWAGPTVRRAPKARDGVEYLTQDPSGKLDPATGQRWTEDFALAERFQRPAISSRDKLDALNGGHVTHLARNTSLVYLDGRRVAKYNKAMDFHEVFDDRGDTVYVPGNSMPVFTVDNVTYGIEICLDHAVGALRTRLASRLAPQVVALMSAWIPANGNRLPDPNAIVLHSSSNIAECGAGQGGQTGTGATLEVSRPDYDIYRYDLGATGRGTLAGMTSAVHPREALYDPDEAAVPPLPVCDHYSGVEARMKKSLALQAELGPVFDVTLDGEDGAPVGGEVEHAQLIAELANGSGNRFDRVGARVLPVTHPRFEAQLDALVGRAGAKLAYLMIPKPRGMADFERAARAVEEAARHHAIARTIPLHALVETHGALRDVQALAAHPRVESLSFGLMDFVSAHRGAIPQSAMGVQGQFDHPLVLRAKLEIAAACHAAGKVPSHCVVTEFRNTAALAQAAQTAARRLGYTRMWSIHPDQVRVIVEAFAPTAAEIDQAVEIITAAQAAQWAPIRHRDTLHDRASYRYFWQVIERAHRTSLAGGPQLPAEVRLAYFGAADL